MGIRFFLDAVNVILIALMAVVTLNLAATIIIKTQGKGLSIFSLDYLDIGIVAIAAILTIRFQANAVWLILGSALISWLFSSQ
jgi:hypothetical protein